MFNELINEISKDIQKHEHRSRLRTTEEQSRFEYAVKYILTDLWKSCYSIPIRECSINLRRTWKKPRIPNTCREDAVFASKCEHLLREIQSGIL